MTLWMDPLEEVGGGDNRLYHILLQPYSIGSVLTFLGLL